VPAKNNSQTFLRAKLPNIKMERIAYLEGVVKEARRLRIVGGTFFALKNLIIKGYQTSLVFKYLPGQQQVRGEPPEYLLVIPVSPYGGLKRTQKEFSDKSSLIAYFEVENPLSNFRKTRVKQDLQFCDLSKIKQGQNTHIDSIKVRRKEVQDHEDYLDYMSREIAKAYGLM